MGRIAIYDLNSGKILSETELKEGVPVLSQFPEFPTGCESVSTVMALKFYGENISCTRFIDEYLPKNADYYYDSGKRFGPSPYEYFIGSPRTAASYGCMAPVIEKALCDYFGNSVGLKTLREQSLTVFAVNTLTKVFPL